MVNKAMHGIKCMHPNIRRFILWTATMEGSREDIIHSPNCQIPPISNKCSNCYKEYNRLRKARRRKEIKDSIPQTRNVIENNRSIYSAILCNICKDKQRSEFCSDCDNKYERAKSKKYYENKKKNL